MLSCHSLRDLYQHHATELLYFARRRVGTQEAEDVVQDAYLHFLQRNQAEPIGNPRAYLFRVTANAAVDQLRRSRIRTSHHADQDIELDDIDNTRTGEADTFHVWRLRAALAELPAIQSEVFLLNRFEGLTYAEIASQLSLSVRTIDRYVSKASAFLQEQMRED